MGISIVAQVMKTEELDAKVENDFLSFCGTHISDIQDHKERLLMSRNSHITADDLVRVSRQRGMPINPEIAEEMIFDASDCGKVSFDELIATIETVSRNESLPRSQMKPGFTNRRELIPGFMNL